MVKITIKKIYNKAFGKYVYLISKDNRGLYWAKTKKDAEKIVSKMK